MDQATHSMRQITGKPAGYFNGVRADMIATLPQNPKARILEIGCGEGGTGALAKAEGKCGTYVGIELDPAAAQEARKALDLVIEANVEDYDFAEIGAGFDAVILSEVLEHLVDPWTVLERIRAVMQPGGLVLASSPNIAHHKIIKALLRGRFEYAASGAMDQTHLRWFTPNSYRDMFEEAGFETVALGPLNMLGRKARILNALSLGRFAHLFASQITYEGRVPIQPVKSWER
jgi:2-polyprenyl-3-methyl-5-hydroxy-6-metoxy-1,4-benzoquinol methylase